MTTPYDPQTLAFYDREAHTYAAKERGAGMPESFTRFAGALPEGAHVLDLGSGDGHFAAAFEARGFSVTAMDASASLAAIAGRRLSHPVRVARFDELEDLCAFDGVWAHASLLHAPRASLGNIFHRIFRSLRPGGILHASFKTGMPEGRDRLGRYYNFPGRADLETALSDTWQDISFTAGEGTGYDGLSTGWIILFARKPAS